MTKDEIKDARQKLEAIINSSLFILMNENTNNSKCIMQARAANALVNYIQAKTVISTINANSHSNLKFQMLYRFTDLDHSETISALDRSMTINIARNYLGYIETCNILGLSYSIKDAQKILDYESGLEPIPENKLQNILTCLEDKCYYQIVKELQFAHRQVINIMKNQELEILESLLKNNDIENTNINFT